MEPVSRSRAKTPYNLRKLVKLQTEPRNVEVAAFWALSLSEQAERLVELARNGLNLMLGLRTRYLGFLYLGGTKSPALLELAPAVWNAQYFQVSRFDRFCAWDPNMRTQRVASRAQLIPSISSALANLTNTQSPELRRKIESLVPEAAADSEPEVSDELQRRIQVLLLRSARDHKIRASSVQKAFIGNDFTDYTNLDRVKEPLHVQEEGQSQETASGLADHDLMHLELESSRDFMNCSAVSAEGTTVDLGPEDSYLHSDMEVAEWIDDDMASCLSESLLEHRGFYDESIAWGETLDPIHGDREYQRQHVDREAAFQGHGWENTVCHYESDDYDHCHEMSDIRQPTAHSFEDCSAESKRAAMTLKDSGDDLSDFVSDECEVVDTEIYDHLYQEGIFSGEWQYDPCESNNDHEEPMLDVGDTDDEPGPNYLTWGHVHHSQPEAAEDNTGIGLRRAPGDWSQVPRNHARHGIDERGGHPGSHPTAFTTRLAGYQ